MCKLSKKEQLIKEIINVISTYNQKLTLRQIYYRLVAKLTIQNTISQYKYLSSILVEARKNGLVRYDAIEDRTRDIINKAKIDYKTLKNDLFDTIDYIKDNRHWIPDNLYQQKIVLIGLEKQALEGVFRNIIDKYSNAILVVCRGYNSLTQIWELTEILKKENRQVHLRFFSDFDPSGLDIQRNFIEQCKDLKLEFDSFERIALNEVQIKKYALPFAPTKLSDSRAKNWKYEGVVELDALDPNVLEQMIEKCCQENWDQKTKIAKDRFEIVLNRIYKRRYSKELINVAEELKKE